MSFEAKYHGRCNKCEEPVEPGDLAEYDWIGEIVHVACPTPVDDDAPQRNERRCADCFTVHAGECL
jgi:hypothetical protein